MQASTKTKPLGTAADLARRLNTTKHRAYALIRERRIPGVVKVGRQVRVDLDAVEQWIAGGGAEWEAAAGAER